MTLFMIALDIDFQIINYWKEKIANYFVLDPVKKWNA